MDDNEKDDLKWYKVRIERGDTLADICETLRKKCDYVAQRENLSKFSDSVFEKKLQKSVYVIRFAENFRIKYELGSTPVLYIGQGKFRQRLGFHLVEWLDELFDYTNETAYEVFVSFPRVQKCEREDEHLEALLIEYFMDKYGAIPFKNKQKEYPKYPHRYKKSVFRKALDVNMNSKSFSWEISPLGFIEEIFCKRRYSDED